MIARSHDSQSAFSEGVPLSDVRDDEDLSPTEEGLGDEEDRSNDLSSSNNSEPSGCTSMASSAQALGRRLCAQASVRQFFSDLPLNAIDRESLQPIDRSDALNSAPQIADAVVRRQTLDQSVTIDGMFKLISNIPADRAARKISIESSSSSKSSSRCQRHQRTVQCMFLLNHLSI